MHASKNKILTGGKILVHKTSFEVASSVVHNWSFTRDYVGGQQRILLELLVLSSIQKRSCLHFLVFTFNRLVPPDAARVFGHIPSMQTAFLLIQYSSHIGLLQRYLISLIWAQNALRLASLLSHEGRKICTS